MFRQPFARFNARGFVRLRPSDRRRFQETVADMFSINLETAELLVPEVLFSASFETSLHFLGVAYFTSERVPLWFTLGKESKDYIPTVYTLWKCPGLLPILKIPGKVVPRMLHAPFLVGSESEISFQSSVSLSAGQLVCITQDYDYEPTMDRTVRVGPALAVGRMVIPSDLVERGKKGKALTLLHAWKDQLWEMGGGEKPPRPQLLQGNLNKEDDTDRERTGGRNETDAKPQSKIFENEGSLRGLSQEEVSDALRAALLVSISVALSKVPPQSFSIPLPAFYEKYILPYRSFQLMKAVSTLVDIEHSEFGSSVTFLKACAGEGLIKINKTEGGMVVTGVDSAHPVVRACPRHVTVKEVEAYWRKREEEQAQEFEKFQEERRKQQGLPLRRPNPVIVPVFRCIGKDPREFLMEEEIKAIIGQYLTSKSLFKPDDPRLVDVSQDSLLLDIVLNGKKGKGAQLARGKFMETNEVIDGIVNSKKAWYKTPTGNKRPAVREDTPSPISIKVVRLRNHTITYISGLETFGLDPARLARRLRRTCASSAAVQPEPRNPGSKKVMVQGEHVKAVGECLAAKGIPKDRIQVVNNLATKAKRKAVRGITRTDRCRYRDPCLWDLP